VEITVDGHAICRAAGHSKKQAEQNAALQAIQLLYSKNN